MGEIATHLRALATLLHSYDLEPQAVHLERLVKLSAEDMARFSEEVRDDAVWGAAGSIVDGGPLTGKYQDEEQARRDQAAFRDLVVRLIDALEEQGLATEEMRSLGRAFSELNELET